MTARRPFALVTATLATVGVTLVASALPAAAASPIQITRVYVNSPGADTRSNTSLNAEYVRITNTGTTGKSLKGYTVRDESKHVYTFGTFTLGAGKTVTLHTGKGTNTATNRYWGSTAYVWNNSGGDSATLRTASGAKVDSCSWRTVASYVTC